MLAYSWTLALASRKATMFWTSVSRSESTGGRRRLALVQGSGLWWASMPLRGALAPARGQALSTAWRRHSCAWAPARARTSVHAQVHVLAGARAPAPACASVHVQAHALAGARARESRRRPCGTPWDQARRQCASPSPSMPRGWALAQSGDGSQNGSGDRRGVFPQGQFKLVPKRLMFLRLRLGVFLGKLEY